MRPLPPPRSDRPPNQPPNESRPSSHVIPQSATAQDPAQTSNTMAQGDGRKKRKHRGGKKKRNRRHSFAAPSEDSTLPGPSLRPSHDPLVEEESEAAVVSARRPFYGRSQGNGNLSSTSLDSDALLDHRCVHSMFDFIGLPLLRYEV